MRIHSQVYWSEHKWENDNYKIPLCDFIGDDFAVPFPEFKVTDDAKEVNCEECLKIINNEKKSMETLEKKGE